MAQKNAWVTGASSGIGREVTLRMVDRGWRVLASARNGSALEALEKGGPGAGKVVPGPVDVTDGEAMTTLVSDFEARYGAVDTVILNAGDYRPMPAAEFSAELCQRLMAVNYQGVVNGIAAVLPGMLERGRGEILINASVAGYRGLPLAAPYGASKAALIALAESLRAELGDSGVQVRVINPGFVKTALTAQNPFQMPALLTPEQAAESIVSRVGGRGFEITFPLRFTWFLKLLRCLPYKLYFPLIRRITGIGR